MDEHEATVWADEDPPVWGRAVDMILEKAAIRAERDALVAACVAESWRGPCRTDGGGVLEHVWEWQLAGMGGTEPTRERAVAALMRAAGLKAKGG